MPRAKARAQAHAAWSGRDDFLITLSVRSGFDLLLRAMRLPAGSEVLLSALTVPDMVRIVEHHGLIPVPIDIDASGNLCMKSLGRAITPRSRVLVVAHLFGGRMPMDEVIALAKGQGLLVVEDLAQGFKAVGDAGHGQSDVALFSFGPIKTATAVGGAVVRVGDAALRQRMAELLAGDPVQPRIAFARRLIKYASLKLMTGRRSARLLRAIARCLGYDFDTVANGLVRGFGAKDLMGQLRRQPSVALLWLLVRRWRTYDFSRIDRRVQLGRRMDRALGRSRSAGDVYWVYPLFVPDAQAIRDRLCAAGFDATCRARMAVVPALGDGRAAEIAQQRWRHFVFLPWFAEMPDRAIDQMAALIASARHD